MHPERKCFMEMDKNSINETSRQEEDFDLDGLINDFSDAEGDDENDDSLEPLPLSDLLDGDGVEDDDEERITELDEENGGDYATLAREFVSLDISVEESEPETVEAGNVIELDDSIDEGIEDDDVPIDLNLSDINANTSEFEVLQYSDDEDAAGHHIEMAGDMEVNEEDPVPASENPFQAAVHDDGLENITQGEDKNQPEEDDGITLEGSLEDIELEEYSSDVDGVGEESSYGVTAEAEDEGIIDLDLDFGDDDETMAHDSAPENHDDEDSSTNDFLGLSSLSLFSSGAGADSETMFSGVEMDFENQVQNVTRAEILLAMGKKDDAVTLFREVSAKKGETNWVTKRLRMLAS